MSYISKPKGIDVSVGDINNDGLQDVFIAYSDKLSQTFFNRGFRSFGHAKDLDIDALLPEAAQGQQSGCLADFTGEGLQNLAIVLANGDAWLLTRKVEDSPRSATVALAPAGTCNGPVTIKVWKDKRCLGASTISVGDAGAFVGVSEAGPVTIKWCTPDGKSLKKDIVIMNDPVRVIIN